MLHHVDMREGIIWAYRLLLNREPSEADVQAHLALNLNPATIRDMFVLSPEFAASSDRSVNKSDPAGYSPFWHYHSLFDAQALIRKYALIDVQPSQGFLTNFIGVKIDPKFFPSILDDRAGTVDDIPIPANWHADIAEWGAALRAVELSGPTFTMIELGCGWGCWMNNTGAVARRMGKEVHLIGVEGDKGHIQFAHESLATNGFAADEIALFHGIAAGHSGTALFPKQDQAGASWALQPIYGATDEQRHQAVMSNSYDELPMLALADIIGERRFVDLLHIDIQGGEADFIEECLTEIQQRIRYILIGTHSREIEGRLFQILEDAGFRLEIERPAILTISETANGVLVDGVQGWRNINPIIPLTHV